MSLEESGRDNVEAESSVSAMSGVRTSRSLGSEDWITIFAGGGLLAGAAARRSLTLALAGGALIYRGATGRWPFSGTLGLAVSRDQPHPATSVPHETGIRVEHSILIDKSPEIIFRFWRQLENLPRFMSQLQEVRRLDEKRSHWKLKTVAGASVEWDAEIINERPNELLAWRSLEGSDIDHAGSVHFEPGPQGGTNVRVVMEYRPPAGRLGAEIARLIGQDPAQILANDLQSLRQVLSAGNVAPADARQPHGAGA
jgi:uncharacterized membrane protein